eukprot:m.1216457 g.1216457  ORF g.1216457 m.1216457 type:complete len:117 (+) comp24613_c0_seq37:3324-3674(+)
MTLCEYTGGKPMVVDVNTYRAVSMSHVHGDAVLSAGNARKRSRNLYIGFSFVGAGFAFLTVGVVLSFMLGTDHAEGALCGIPSDVKDLGIHYGPSFLMYVASAVLVSLSFLLVVCC